MKAISNFVRFVVASALNFKREFFKLLANIDPNATGFTN